KVAVVSFGTSATKDNLLSPNIDAAIAAIENLSLPPGTEQTNIGDGLYLAFQELGGQDGRADAKKVLV
ncbi:hypothetical protein, partial [Klebsiella pneumoniae]|uniref:hypothetical protein n=1 Tax=Klebsiella pneumoniae TaxID=573 RepID=UPI00190F7A1F